MNAIISGQAGVALLLDGATFLSFDVDDPDTLLPRRQADLHLLFGEATDLQFIEKVDHKSAAQELERAFNCASALDLALILLDRELSTEVRKDAADELEHLLSDLTVQQYLENVLYGRPLPATADMAGALEHCISNRVPNLLTTLQILEESQPAILEVCQAWHALPVHLFGAHKHKAEFQNVAIKAGLFREFASELANERYAEQLLAKSLRNPAFTALKNYGEVLQQWMKIFRRNTTAIDIKHGVVKQVRQKTLSRERQDGRRKNINRQAVLNDVQSQKTLRIQALQRRDLDRAQTLRSLARLPEVSTAYEAFINKHSLNEEAGKWLSIFCDRYDFAIFEGAYGPDDLFLESLEKVLKFAPKLKPENTPNERAFYGWLKTVVHNTFLDARRKLNKLENHGHSRSAAPADLLDASALEMNYEGKYFLSRFLKFIERYSEKHRYAIEYWLEGRSYREIAAALNNEGISDCSHVTVWRWIEAITTAFIKDVEETLPK